MLVSRFLAATVLPLLMLSGCVGTDYRLPAVGENDVNQMRSELQKEAVAVQLQRRARLYDLAWPVIEKNTEFCQKQRPSIGLVFADAEMAATYVGGFEKRHMEAVGFSDEIQVLYAISGGPAEQAGVRVGWKLKKVAGEVVGEQAISKISKKIKEALEEQDRVLLTFETEEGERREVQLESAKVCDVAIKLSTSSQLNALATSSTIIFNAGLLSRLSDDGAQYVLSHELAHVTLKHPRKVTQNSILSGGVIAAPVLYSGGYIVDKTLKLFGQDPVKSYAARGLAIAVPYSAAFEAEADYLGLYMFARAGGDLGQAEEAFRLFAQESPSSTWLSYTHPMTPERIVRLRAALNEIEVSLNKGEELTPRKHD